MAALLRVGRSGVVDDRHDRLVFGADFRSLSVSHCEASGRYLSPWIGDDEALTTSSTATTAQNPGEFSFHANAIV